MQRSSLALVVLALGSIPDAQRPVVVAPGANRLAINDRGDLAYVVPNPSGDVLFLQPALSTGPARPILTAGLTLPSSTLLIEEIGPFTIDSAGRVVASLGLSDAADPSLHEGLFRGDGIALSNGDAVVAPGLTASAVWYSFDRVVAVSGADPILVSGQVDDPAILGFADEALLSFAFDAAGNARSFEVFALESAPAPGLPFTIRPGSLPNDPGEAAINARGDVLWGTKLTGPPSSTDSVVYLNEVPLLREGDPSPIAGRNWGDLSSARLDLNEAGDWLVRADLAGPSTGVLLENGVVRVSEGDVLPGNNLTIRRLYKFTSVALTDGGEPIYLASVGPGGVGGSGAILVGDRIVALEGETSVNGLLIQDLPDLPDRMTVSPNGRFLVFRAGLESGFEVFVFLDLGRSRRLTACTPNEGVLSHSSGFPVVGGSFDLRMEGAQSPLATRYLMLSGDTQPSYPPCGLTLPFGELIINFGNGDPFFVQQLLLNPTTFYLSPTVALANVKTYAQGIFLDPTSVPSLRLTNALEIEFGAP